MHFALFNVGGSSNVEKIQFVWEMILRYSSNKIHLSNLSNLVSFFIVTQPQLIYLKENMVIESAKPYFVHYPTYGLVKHPRYTCLYLVLKVGTMTMSNSEIESQH